MQRCFWFICLTLFSLLGTAQNDSLILTLDLVKPDKWVGEKMFFRVVLTNTTSDKTYLIPSTADASRGMSSALTSFLVPETQWKDGSLHTGKKQGFIYLGMSKRYVILAPGDSYTCRKYVDYKVESGLISYGEMTRTVKLRVSLQNFRAVETHGEQARTVEWILYSNWLDVSGEDFSPFVQQ